MLRERRRKIQGPVCPVWMAPFLQVLFRAWHFVRSSLVFGLLARRTWPLALMVSTNQVPFRTSNSKRSGQSSGCLGFRADKVPSLHWSCKLSYLRWCVQAVLTLYGSFRVSTAQIIRAVLLAMATAATLLGLRDKMSANHGSNLSGSNLMDRIRDVMPKTNNRRIY